MNGVSITYDSYLIKNIHREKAPSNESPLFTKGMNVDIWVVGASN